MTPALPNRRVVTGLDADGRSCVIFDGPTPVQKTTPDRPGYASAFVWKTDQAPASNDGNGEAAAEPFDHAAFPPGGTAFFIFRQPGGKDLEGLTPEQREHALHGGLPPSFRERAGGAASMPGMHATNSVDYIVIVEGEITLMLETGEVTLKAGDVLVDRGVAHAWENRGEEACLMVTVMVDAKPLTPVGDFSGG